MDQPILCVAPIDHSHLLRLVVSTPLKNMRKSVGMMTFPIYMESHKIPWFQSPPTSPDCMDQLILHVVPVVAVDHSNLIE